MADLVPSLGLNYAAEESDSDDMVLEKTTQVTSFFGMGAVLEPALAFKQQSGRSALSSSVAVKVAKRREAAKAAKAAQNQEDSSDFESDSEAEDEEEAATQQTQQKQKKKDASPADEEVSEGKHWGSDNVGSMSSFADLNLCRPLQKAINSLNWRAPTPVQCEAIPEALKGRDLLVNAVTGSGKTAAFMLPTLERLVYGSGAAAVRVLVLTPTRELANQCKDMTQALCKHTDITVTLAVGGLPMGIQANQLQQKPDIVIGTPGRILDHLYNTRGFGLESVEVIIFDEADRLLEEGFEDEIRSILKSCQKERQTLMFSATMSQKVRDMVNLALKRPKHIAIDAHYSITHHLAQEFIRLKKTGDDMDERIAHTLALMKRTFTSKVIIFCRMKVTCHRLMILGQFLGLKTAELHGNLTQVMRMEALEMFKTGACDFLICTDVAARGLDIPGVATVINMEMPRSIVPYIHRVGRTARAGKAGLAVSIVGQNDRKLLKDIVKKAPSQVRSRAVPAAVINKYLARVAKLEPEVKAVLAEEREERAIDRAELEAKRLANMVIHHDEIHSRPAKKWHLSAQEKQAKKEKSRQKYHDPDGSQARAAMEKEESEKKRKRTKKEVLATATRRERRHLVAKWEAEREEALRRRELRRQGLPVPKEPFIYGQEERDMVLRSARIGKKIFRREEKEIEEEKYSVYDSKSMSSVKKQVRLYEYADDSHHSRFLQDKKIAKKAEKRKSKIKRKKPIGVGGGNFKSNKRFKRR